MSDEQRLWKRKMLRKALEQIQRELMEGSDR